MDVLNLTPTSSPAPTPMAGDVAGTVGRNKSATQGNSLPALGKAALPPDHSQQAPSANQPNSEELQNLVDQANKELPAHSSELKFSVAEGTDINVVRIEDSQTGELIRQIPSEQMVEIARAFKESRQGMMLKEKA